MINHRGPHLAINASRQLRLNHHDQNPKHATDQRVIAQQFALPKESLPLAEPVADILGLLLFGVAFFPGRVVAVGLAGILTDAFGEGVLQDGAVEEPQRVLAGAYL